MTDPAVGAILAHLDTNVILSRNQAAKGIYPAVDPLVSGSRMMDRVGTQIRSPHRSRLGSDQDTEVNSFQNSYSEMSHAP
ncbi:MAG: hypothetical protein KA482_11845 [Sphingobium sp.]|nr:hypothetical protein [Sphingobium sp.]